MRNTDVHRAMVYHLSTAGGAVVGLIFWRYLRSSHDEFWHHVMVDPSADEQLALSALVTFGARELEAPDGLFVFTDFLFSAFFS